MAGQTSQIDVQLAGLNKPVVPFVTGLTYTALNQPKAWVWNHGLAGLPPLNTRYSYDANSNRLSSINTTTSDTDQDGDFDAVDFSKTTSHTSSRSMN